MESIEYASRDQDLISPLILPEPSIQSPEASSSPSHNTQQNKSVYFQVPYDSEGSSHEVTPPSSSPVHEPDRESVFSAIADGVDPFPSIHSIADPPELATQDAMTIRPSQTASALLISDKDLRRDSPDSPSSPLSSSGSLVIGAVGQHCTDLPSDGPLEDAINPSIGQGGTPKRTREIMSDSQTLSLTDGVAAISSKGKRRRIDDGMSA